jgi:hypothetical protein
MATSTTVPWDSIIMEGLRRKGNNMSSSKNDDQKSESGERESSVVVGKEVVTLAIQYVLLIVILMKTILFLSFSIFLNIDLKNNYESLVVNCLPDTGEEVASSLQ